MLRIETNVLWLLCYSIFAILHYYSFYIVCLFADCFLIGINNQFWGGGEIALPVPHMLAKLEGRRRMRLMSPPPHPLTALVSGI